MHASLSIEQAHAVDLLMQGKSDRAVAEAVGVTRQTVCDWRNHNPAVIAELTRRKQLLWGYHLERLRRLAGKAMDVLEEDLALDDSRLNEPKRRIRQTAALHILRASGLFGDTLRPPEPDEILEED
jgi:transposase